MEQSSYEKYQSCEICGKNITSVFSTVIISESLDLLVMIIFHQHLIFLEFGKCLRLLVDSEYHSISGVVINKQKKIAGTSKSGSSHRSCKIGVNKL